MLYHITMSTPNIGVVICDMATPGCGHYGCWGLEDVSALRCPAADHYAAADQARLAELGLTS
jgi:hypothetical protein